MQFGKLPIIFLATQNVAGSHVRNCGSNYSTCLSGPFSPRRLITIINGLVRQQTTRSPRNKSAPSVTILTHRVRRVGTVLTKRGHVIGHTSSVHVSLAPHRRDILSLITRKLVGGRVTDQLSADIQGMRGCIDHLFDGANAGDHARLIHFTLRRNLIGWGSSSKRKVNELAVSPHHYTARLQLYTY